MVNKSHKFCLVVFLISGFVLILMALITKTKMSLEGTVKVGINGK